MGALSGPVAIFGATSGIAQAVSAALLQKGTGIVLCGRKPEALDRQARDLELRFNREVPRFAWDVLDMDQHKARFRELLSRHSPGGLFMAVGWMPDQELLESEPRAVDELFRVNVAGPVAVMSLFAGHFAERRSGFISCLSSVAGDRGRAGNYMYGASKAALSVYLQGLRHRLAGSGVLIQTVKPGPVRTPMTAQLPDSPLMASAQTVARDIVEALGKPRTTLYTPWYWRCIMCFLRLLPEAIFHRLRV